MNLYGYVGGITTARTASPVRGLPRTGKGIPRPGDPTHNFPNIVDNYAGNGKNFKIPRRDKGRCVVGQDDLLPSPGWLYRVGWHI